ncbi:Bardet-Biedl syndrome 5 protein like [Schistosoma japonicum]|nr:Bardet-Biedl syndrome 5 protein like [Schistosoma japonicum]KAH8876007.1 Bardet-Biedl syndrome 5 protein like [Schistosoma japonicum]KAH8876008.1 Bardet-Biedl syndrome 5 protein like [Schistosoma japonicum]
MSTQLYDSTRIYRELRVRGAFMKGNSLVLLPLETLFDEVEGVWNLSSDQGNLGKLMLTSIRLVWTSIMNENFNISVPFLQIQMVATRNSKFGEALVVQTTRKAGSYLLGFRIDPPESLHNTVKQLGSLHNIYMKSPNFGIAISRAKDEVKNMNEDIDDYKGRTTRDHSDILSAYLADGTKQTDREPVYNEDLGLAIERLPEKYTISDLWKVIPRKKIQ